MSEFLLKCNSHAMKCTPKTYDGRDLPIPVLPTHGIKGALAEYRDITSEIDQRHKQA
jgi:hypothetical protein